MLQSGRKSFTLQPNQEDMKHLTADQKVKGIEVKFYPYPGSNDVYFPHSNFQENFIPESIKLYNLTLDSRHNAGYYVKHVQPTSASVLEAHSMKVDKSNGTGVPMRKFGIKRGWLCCNSVHLECLNWSLFSPCPCLIFVWLETLLRGGRSLAFWQVGIHHKSVVTLTESITSFGEKCVYAIAGRVTSTAARNISSSLMIFSQCRRRSEGSRSLLKILAPAGSQSCHPRGVAMSTL